MIANETLVLWSDEDRNMKNVKVKFALPDYKDLLQYGEIESEFEFNCPEGVEKIRKIRFFGILYHLKTINDDMVCLKQWDCFPYDEDEDENDIRPLTEDELAHMLMFSDRDRKNNEKAERVYWLCIFEINRRNPYEDDEI